MAQLLREAAEEVVRRTPETWEDPLADLIGVVKEGPTDIAERHDAYLARR
jgi:hypothetical protein